MRMPPSLIYNIGIVIQLVILEGLLSFDNALALAALVSKRLTSAVDRRRALTWGIWGAYGFRTIVIFIGTWLMANPWVKVIAGAYLIWLAVDELFLKHEKGKPEHEIRIGLRYLSPLWATIVSVELMDIMFSVDSIGVALALSREKWVLILGAALGILMMRMAATLFVRLIKRFPILIKTAFVLVGIAGVNIMLGIKGLPIPFTGGFRLTIDRPIPEYPFLALLFAVLIGSIALNGFFPRLFKPPTEEETRLP
jgi:YkoY family integral membrane protein